MTAAYLARADQLEIKIAQGWKPGEADSFRVARRPSSSRRCGAARPAGATSARPAPRYLFDRGPRAAGRRPRRGEPGRSASARPSRGVGTSPRLAKAGAVHPPVGGSGRDGRIAARLYQARRRALGDQLAEVHQVLLRTGSRPGRAALRRRAADRARRPIAALLGAEKFAFWTAPLVAIGCDMARQCHLDACPTGIATQRDDLRAKFAGSPERRRAVLHRDRRGRPSRARPRRRPLGRRDRRREPPAADAGPAARAELAAVVGAARGRAIAARRADPAGPDGSAMRRRRVEARSPRRSATRDRSPPRAPVTTADRSFGAVLTGALERGELRGPIRLGWRRGRPIVRGVRGAGRRAAPGGQANDYVGKGLSGGRSRSPPSPTWRPTRRARPSPATRPLRRDRRAAPPCRPGRDALRRPQQRRGGRVEGIGPHGCEYMTGGTVVVLARSARLGAGMTGGRAYLYDPSGRHVAALHGEERHGPPACSHRPDPEDGRRCTRAARLLEASPTAGSALAGRLLDDADLPAEM